MIVLSRKFEDKINAKPQHLCAARASDAETTRVSTRVAIAVVFLGIAVVSYVVGKMIARPTEIMAGKLADLKRKTLEDRVKAAQAVEMIQKFLLSDYTLTLGKESDPGSMRA